MFRHEYVALFAEHQSISTTADACTCGHGNLDKRMESGERIQAHWDHLARVICVKQSAPERVRKPSAGRVRVETQAKWTDWLASIGYGIDYSGPADPPCTLDELADAYVRITGEEDRTTWALTITEQTDGFKP